ncbi:MAG: glycine betaine ABC transporter substrate-binding protein [Pseudomonadota bacterium]|nr:glycine betaine ABC transporter substrate-binding protein [Pseudomonadota bacterium]
MRVLAVLALIFAATLAEAADIRIGSKKFTESVILGEAVSHLIRDAGGRAIHRREIGGTRVLFQALLKGEIDIYAEYTGTLSQEILAGQNLDSDEKIRSALARRGIVMGRPLGFNNTYAIGMNEDQAGRLGIKTISDLRSHPDLRFGLGNEFMNRGDGWPSLRERYGLPQTNVRGLDHDLAYRGLAAGGMDAMDVYTTDAEISYYGLRLLRDDLNHFPVYDAVLIWRAGLDANFAAALRRIEGRIDAAAMGRMNAAVKLDKISELKVAADFVNKSLGISADAEADGVWRRFQRHTMEHLTLVAISLAAAIALSVPLGILAARRRRLGQFILAVAGVIQTIPSLALFVFMIPLLGIGGPPALVALFLYSLLPIIRNTHAGLTDISPSIRESAEALGLPPGARLRLVELPLAARAILAGIKTSAVINVGTATLGALIGAGGYGQPILTGIRLDDIGLILEGAIPAAMLALLAQGVFEIAERMIVAKGLRLKTSS